MEKLSLKYNNNVVRMACCVVNMDSFPLSAHGVLSQQELEKYNSFKVNSGKIGCLLGRYSAKRAYINLLNEDIDFREIDIRNGIFGQPYFPNDANFDVSISHSQNMGGAIVFDKAFPMGFDLEVIDEERLEAIKLFVSDNWLEHFGVDYKSNITAIWCMKEALSKAIRTGLTIPLDLLKINNVRQNGKFFECHFENFPQYRGIAEISETYAMSIVCPEQLIIGDLI